MACFRNMKLWKDSAMMALAAMGILSSVITITGYSIVDYLGNIFSNASADIGWKTRLNYVVLIYVSVMLIALLFNLIRANRGVSIIVRGITVNIKKGDIFSANGWRIIPFNERFDTSADDKVIAQKTLHGQYILMLGDKIHALQRVINADDKETRPELKRYAKHNRLAYPLGRVLIHGNYMLLSFTHFNEQNEAYLTDEAYKRCLMTMWKEVSRVYADKPIFLPLLGSGMTRFVDSAGTPVPKKSDAELLLFLLYTLELSGEHINQPITIFLAEKNMRNINLYTMKGDWERWHTVQKLT